MLRLTFASHLDPRRSEGFWLVEALVAVGVLATVSASVAELALLANRAALASRESTVTLLAAVQRMEQLRGLSWTYRGPRVAPLTDLETDLGADPPRDGGRGLLVSPADSLAADRSGYVDFLDAEGRWLSGTAGTVGVRFVRRWSIRRVGRSDGHLLALDVIVMPVSYAHRTRGTQPSPSDPGVVWLATLRARR